MYDVSAQGVDERMINVHYYYVQLTVRYVNIQQLPNFEMGNFCRNYAFFVVVSSFALSFFALSIDYLLLICLFTPFLF